MMPKAVRDHIFAAVHSTNVLCLMERKHQDYFFIIEVKKGCNKYDMERSIDEYPLVYVHLVNVYNK